MASKTKIVEVACVIMADGEVNFVPVGSVHVNTAMLYWKEGLSKKLFQEHTDAGTGGGVVVIKMLARDYLAMTKKVKGFGDE